MFASSDEGMIGSLEGGLRMVIECSQHKSVLV